MSTLPSLESRLEFAIKVALKAQDLILGYYQRDNFQVESKHDSTPVTVADRGAEELIRAELAIAFPDDGILGEEFPEKKGTNSFRWILDPIDGTKSFVHGVPLFGTLIGLEYEGKCVLGVCRFPALNEVVYAAKGQGAWWQVGDQEPKRAKVSGIGTFKESCFSTTNLSRWSAEGIQDAYDFLSKNVKLTRGWGDCFGHMLVATGRIELMVDPSLSPWDAAALLPILEEAGGYFLDRRGEATIYGGNGFSVNAALKDEVLKLFAKK